MFAIFSVIGNLCSCLFFVTVGMNALALQVLPEMTLKPTVAWVISQGTATAINFVMLKWVVFREPSREDLRVAV